MQRVNRKYIRKPKYVRRAPAAAVSLMSKTLFSKSNVLKMVLEENLNSNAAGNRAIHSLLIATKVRACTDWASLKNTYQLWNLLSVKILVFPGATFQGTNAAPNTMLFGMCYDTKDAAVIGSFNGAFDKERYLLFGTAGTDARRPSVFKFTPKPTRSPPFSTADIPGEEPYGWIKTYSDNYGADGVYAVKLFYEFTIAFSSQA